LGPGWQANSSIGRAIRFILNNIGGAKIGITDMTTIGMAENLTYCLGENEEKNPWEPPFHVEQGFKKEDSTVSVIGAYSPEHVSDHVGVDPKEILTVAADVITRLTRFHTLTTNPFLPRESIFNSLSRTCRKYSQGRMDKVAMPRDISSIIPDTLE